jgi:5-methyltetrahydropteroyltriglutamate--homocysteine methyltransferase
MLTSTDRILTTHTGSLPRPAGLTPDAPDAEVAAAVADVVRRQRAAGLDVINDGEAGKPSYATYVLERLSGFGNEADTPFLGRGRADLADFPGYRERLSRDQSGAIGVQPVCTGDVRYTGRDRLDAELANLRAAAGEAAGEVFCTAASPGVIARFMPNRHYPDESGYLQALADAMKEEYDAIAAAGFVLQLDCPDLTAGWHARTGDLSAHRAMVSERLDILDYAVRDIPPAQLRLHLCWGNYEGPHNHDIPLAYIIDLVLAARPSGVSFEGANPRHEHEWALFAEVALPEDTVLIPGVLDSTTNYIEHPALVAQRIGRYAEAVGRERVIAGTDCGFATFAGMQVVDPEIAWAKLAALSEGARLATDRLWKRPLRAGAQRHAARAWPRVRYRVHGRRAQPVHHPGEEGVVEAAHQVGRLGGQRAERAIAQPQARRRFPYGFEPLVREHLAGQRQGPLGAQPPGPGLLPLRGAEPLAALASRAPHRVPRAVGALAGQRVKQDVGEHVVAARREADPDVRG